MNKPKIKIIGSDAGGTMTDIIFVDEDGDFTIGKAATTPKNEIIGFWSSMADAAKNWDIDWEKQAPEILSEVETVVYSGTSMVNVLITRAGAKVGVIVTKGQEDYLIHGRGSQSWAGYSYEDRLHTASHKHPSPMVERSLIKGVTGRVDMFGKEAIPLYEQDVEDAVEYFLDREVESIAVCLLYSYLNNVHEVRVREIANEVLGKRQKEIPIHLSCEVSPIMREGSRLNAVILQAYAAEPARKHLSTIESRLKESGYKYPLQVVLSTGGIANIGYPRLVEAIFSGPIGGVMGAKALSIGRGFNNVLCTDLGGTSFDSAILLGGDYSLEREVTIARMIFNIPTVSMETIGGGTGEYIRIEPSTGRLLLGPDSAGSHPGPVCYNAGNEMPTVMDCCLILGMMNPDYFLGGDIQLHSDLALRAIKEKLADPLGENPYVLSAGVVEMLNSRLREQARATLFAKGFNAADFLAFSYGGAGPLFLAEYTRGLPFKGIFTVPFAAAFSSFGCAGVDLLHRYQQSTMLQILPGASQEEKTNVANVLNSIWDDLEKLAREDFRTEGIPRDARRYQEMAYIRYTGQLDDVETMAPTKRIESPEDLDRLFNAFEDRYEVLYGKGSQHPEAGFQILEVGLLSSSPRTKPILRQYPLSSKEPPKDASKGQREVFLSGNWHTADLWEMDLLEPGNEIQGLAVIEHPATTLFVPPNFRVKVDEWKFCWLERV